MFLALLTLVSSALATPNGGMKLVVKVVNDADEVVPTAIVRIDDENLRHRVNHRTGKWSGRSIYPQDKLPTLFLPGQVLSITVAAPGHIPRTVHYKVHPQKNQVQIPIQPLGGSNPDIGSPEFDLATLLAVSRANCDSGSQDNGVALFTPASTHPISLDPETIRRLGDLRDADPQLTAGFADFLLSKGPGQFDAALQWADIATLEAHSTSGNTYVGLIDDLFRVRALAYHLQWQQRELSYLDEPTRKNKIKADKFRRISASIASEWVAWAEAAGRSAELPHALCMAAADRPLECSP